MLRVLELLVLLPLGLLACSVNYATCTLARGATASGDSQHGQRRARVFSQSRAVSLTSAAELFHSHHATRSTRATPTRLPAASPTYILQPRRSRGLLQSEDEDDEEDEEDEEVEGEEGKEGGDSDEPEEPPAAGADTSSAAAPPGGAPAPVPEPAAGGVEPSAAAPTGVAPAPVPATGSSEDPDVDDDFLPPINVTKVVSSVGELEAMLFRSSSDVAIGLEAAESYQFRAPLLVNPGVSVYLVCEDPETVLALSEGNAYLSLGAGSHLYIFRCSMAMLPVEPLMLMHPHALSPDDWGVDASLHIVNSTVYCFCELMMEEVLASMQQVIETQSNGTLAYAAVDGNFASISLLRLDPFLYVEPETRRELEHRGVTWACSRNPDLYVLQSITSETGLRSQLAALQERADALEIAMGGNSVPGLSAEVIDIKGRITLQSHKWQEAQYEVHDPTVIQGSGAGGSSAAARVGTSAILDLNRYHGVLISGDDTAGVRGTGGVLEIRNLTLVNLPLGPDFKEGVLDFHALTMQMWFFNADRSSIDGEAHSVDELHVVNSTAVVECDEVAIWLSLVADMQRAADSDDRSATLEAGSIKLQVRQSSQTHITFSHLAMPGVRFKDFVVSCEPRLTAMLVPLDGKPQRVWDPYSGSLLPSLAKQAAVATDDGSNGGVADETEPSAPGSAGSARQSPGVPKEAASAPDSKMGMLHAWRGPQSVALWLTCVGIIAACLASALTVTFVLRRALHRNKQWNPPVRSISDTVDDADANKQSRDDIRSGLKSPSAFSGHSRPLDTPPAGVAVAAGFSDSFSGPLRGVRRTQSPPIYASGGAVQALSAPLRFQAWDMDPALSGPCCAANSQLHPSSGQTSRSTPLTMHQARMAGSEADLRQAHQRGSSGRLGRDTSGPLFASGQTGTGGQIEASGELGMEDTGTNSRELMKKLWWTKVTPSGSGPLSMLQSPIFHAWGGSECQTPQRRTEGWLRRMSCSGSSSRLTDPAQPAAEAMRHSMPNLPDTSFAVRAGGHSGLAQLGQHGQGPPTQPRGRGGWGGIGGRGQQMYRTQEWLWGPRRSDGSAGPVAAALAATQSEGKRRSKSAHGAREPPAQSPLPPTLQYAAPGRGHATVFQRSPGYGVSPGRGGGRGARSPSRGHSPGYSRGRSPTCARSPGASQSLSHGMGAARSRQEAGEASGDASGSGTAPLKITLEVGMG